MLFVLCPAAVFAFDEQVKSIVAIAETSDVRRDGMEATATYLNAAFPKILQFVVLLGEAGFIR